jgi:hypothetical protein
MRGPGDLDPAFKEFKLSSVGGVHIVSSSMLFNFRPRLAELSLATKIPAICKFRELVKVGCLAAMGSCWQTYTRSPPTRSQRS